ncbi:MAG: hypothetical protein J5I93_07195 [Pirellulaceae bacterium]|nr:hypothetical protein [Pirellulaceae bacterium]
MRNLIKQFEDLEQMREYVEETICAQNELEVGVFPISERVLLRGGAPCGIYFCLFGPREVRLSAIWDTQRNTVLFYGSSGDRLATVQLGSPTSLAS